MMKRISIVNNRLPAMLLTGLFMLTFVISSCRNGQKQAGQQSPTELSSAVITGAEQTSKLLAEIKGRRVGLAANQSSMIGGKRSIDTLLKLGVKIVRAFGPEHGLNGATSANTFIDHQNDEVTGIPVTSLFGTYFKPNKEDLAGIEVMLFDMQDVGVRFYTYISTLHYIMQACAENNIEVIVLDRPNPNDFYVDGPVLEKGYESFIGMHPIPIVHGMTIGEYALMINGQGWLGAGLKCNIKVIKMQHYAHGMAYTLPRPPSPNLNTPRSVLLYPSLCWFGSTAISDGRGTLFPYQVLGSPGLKGMYSFSFTPKPIKGMNENPMHKGQVCYGLDLRQYDTSVFRKTGRLNLEWLLEMYQAYPDKQKFFNKEETLKPGTLLHFDQLAGNSTLRAQIKSGKTVQEIRESWEPALTAYKQMRKKYLLYPLLN